MYVHYCAASMPVSLQTNTISTGLFAHRVGNFVLIVSVLHVFSTIWRCVLPVLAVLAIGIQECCKWRHNEPWRVQRGVGVGEISGCLCGNIGLCGGYARLFNRVFNGFC